MDWVVQRVRHLSERDMNVNGATLKLWSCKQASHGATGAGRSWLARWGHDTQVCPGKAEPEE